MINAVPLGRGRRVSTIPQPELLIFAHLPSQSPTLFSTHSLALSPAHSRTHFSAPQSIPKLGIPSWMTIPTAIEIKITHCKCRRKECVSKNTIPSRNMAKLGISREAKVAVRMMALTRAGFPSRGAISSLNDLNIFSLIFLFIFLFILYFK